MRILIIGADHRLQPTEPQNLSGKNRVLEQSQKEMFRELLRTKIRENKVQFVAEEARHGGDTVTQRVCAQENCRYANVEMPPEVRTRKKIPEDYYKEVSGLSEEEKARCHKEREEFMASTTMERATEAESILMICGSYHKEALAKLFREQDHTVTTMDLQDEPWYIKYWHDYILQNW